MIRNRSHCGIAIPLVCLAAVSTWAPQLRAQWLPQPSRTDARLRGLCVVNPKVIWASGTKGTYLQTSDGGNVWKASAVPGASDLDFRDLHAFDDKTAHLLAIGSGDKSRIYRTTDGGNSWVLSFQNRDPKGFLDALAFWDADHGIALGDPINGRFMILTTDDGGVSWQREPGAALPPVIEGEGAFAASGTCLVVQGERNAWFGTGGGRVFRSNDRGRSWTVHVTPIAAGNASSGIFSLRFWDANRGIAVGGDYKEPGRAGKVCAITSDGGSTWRLPRGQEPGGYRSAVFHVPGSRGPTVFAVGPMGSDRSDDGGESWAKLSGEGFHSAAMQSPGAGWAVGENGRITRVIHHAKIDPVP
jgi:photosystem II stability/assembly factor-like uncharacterized protein